MKRFIRSPIFNNYFSNNQHVKKDKNDALFKRNCTIYTEKALKNSAFAKINVTLHISFKYETLS
jgi:hypothetical protein